jgi:hypothetical protein
MLAVFLGQCRAGIDELRLKVSSSGDGAVIARASVTLEQSDLDDMANSSAANEIRGISERVAPCGVSQRLYQRGRVLRLDVRADFSDSEDLNSMLNCAAAEWDQPTLQFSLERGYFWDRYRTTFSIRRETPRCAGGDSLCDSELNFFPKRLFLSVPGRIDTVANLTNIVGAHVLDHVVGDNVASLELQPMRDYEAANRANFRANAANRMDVMKIEVSSYDFRYDLNTIASVLALVFGSGLVFEIFRRVSRRRARAAPAD